jgi:hypothetical protein
VQVGVAARSHDHDFELARTLAQRDLREPVAVMREEVAEERHRAAVGVASQDVEAT